MRGGAGCVISRNSLCEITYFPYRVPEVDLAVKEGKKAGGVANALGIGF
jgi:hypothetical protein